MNTLPVADSKEGYGAPSIATRTSVRTTDAALPFVALLDAWRPWTRLDFLELCYCVLADCFGRCGQVLWLWPCEMSVDALR